MAYKIKFKAECCIGCRSCIAACPENWEFDEAKGRAKPKKTKIDEIGKNQKAADACPGGCITIKEEK